MADTGHGKALWFCLPEVLSDECQQDEIQNKEDCYHPDNGMYGFGVLFADFYNAVGNKTESNTVGNAVAKRHEKPCEKGRNCLGKIIPFDFLKRGSHHNSHNNQSRSCGSKGNGAYEGSQE